MSTKIDPIREKYYKPLVIFEMSGNILCWISIILSLCIIIFENTKFPYFLIALQISFVICVIILSVIKIMLKFYLSPRAQERRYKDFLSHAFNTANYEGTKKYYNNNEIIPIRCIAAQTLENSLYSKSIIKDMVKFERAKLIFYILIWLILILYRGIQLNIIIIVTQIIFSEIILNRWITMEFFKYRTEKVFDILFNLFKSKTNGDNFHSDTLEITGIYEMSKANCGITLSERIFLKKEKYLDKEWKEVRHKLNI